MINVDVSEGGVLVANIKILYEGESGSRFVKSDRYGVDGTQTTLDGVSRTGRGLVKRFERKRTTMDLVERALASIRWVKR